LALPLNRGLVGKGESGAAGMMLKEPESAPWLMDSISRLMWAAELKNTFVSGLFNVPLRRDEDMADEALPLESALRCSLNRI